MLVLAIANPSVMTNAQSADPSARHGHVSRPAPALTCLDVRGLKEHYGPNRKHVRLKYLQHVQFKLWCARDAAERRFLWSFASREQLGCHVSADRKTWYPDRIVSKNVILWKRDETSPEPVSCCWTKFLGVVLPHLPVGKKFVPFCLVWSAESWQKLTKLD